MLWGACPYTPGKLPLKMKTEMQKSRFQGTPTPMPLGGSKLPSLPACPSHSEKHFAPGNFAGLPSNFGCVVSHGGGRGLQLELRCWKQPGRAMLFGVPTPSKALVAGTVPLVTEGVFLCPVEKPVMSSERHRNNGQTTWAHSSKSTPPPFTSQLLSFSAAASKTDSVRNREELPKVGWQMMERKN